jgi:hypothetical protein
MNIPMKTTTGSENDLALVRPGISLQALVNQLLSHSMPAAYRSKSLVINDVSRDVKLNRASAKVAPVIQHLLTTVVDNARNGDISVSADRFQDIVILEVQDRNNYNGYALGYSIRAMESEAAMVGGSISIDGEQKKVITISFSFPNQSEAEC